MTPLQHAFYRGHAPVVKLLVGLGADTDFAGTSRGTALQWAKTADRGDLIRILQWHEIDPSATLHQNGPHIPIPESDSVEFGKTALHWAAQTGSTDEIRRILENTKYPNILILQKDNNGLSPLHWAAKSGQTDAAAELLKYDAEKSTVWERDKFGKTPLHHAADKGAVEIMQTLLSVFPRPSELVLLKDRNGKIPLHWAAKHAHLKAVELLLRPPEEIVGGSSWREVVQLMLSETDDNGKTPRLLAGDDAVASMLAEGVLQN
jgi:ankyrin repeat protein